MTSLLKGQAVKTLFASTSVTCSFASRRLNARAQAAPPKPPPTTTTRPADCAREIDGRANDAADAAKYAFSTAGPATQMVGSPTPPQNPPLGITIDSTFGISLMRIEL